jgi:diguanylate cyclase (GGDEF)-like protein
VMQIPVAVISLVDRDRQWFKASHGLDFCQTPRDVSFCTHTIAGEGPLIVPDALDDARFRDLPLVTEQPHIRSYIGVPLRTPEGHNIGALCAMDHLVRHPSADQVEILQDLARLVMDELELRLVATTDSLTGVLSRRAFFEAADRDIARALRHGEILSFALFDLDHFKHVNDAHGHAAGDKALQQVAHLIKSDMRKEDYLGRIGGEEFAVAMPLTDDRRAFDVAERLRARVHNHDFAVAGDDVLLTISLGIATLLPGDRSVEDILARADEALYAAKLGGRNRSVCYRCAPLAVS